MRLIGQCDELKDLSMTPATPGRQLPEIVATNKGFVVPIFINYNPFGEQKPFYVLDEVEKKDDPMSNAEKLYSAKRYREAISALTDILMNDPQNSDAYYFAVAVGHLLYCTTMPLSITIKPFTTSILKKKTSIL